MARCADCGAPVRGADHFACPNNCHKMHYLAAMVRNYDLSEEDVPQPGEPTGPFGHTYDGYRAWGDRCGDVAQKAVMKEQEPGGPGATLSELRTALFFLHRAERFGTPRSAEFRELLLVPIRRLVKAGQAAARMQDKACSRPSCRGHMVVRGGSREPFLGCTEYPDCAEIRRL